MKTSKQDFQLFKTECQKWIDKFELNNWKIYYKHENLGNGHYFGDINVQREDSVATLRLSTDVKADEFDIKRTAKHEILHLLLGRLSRLGEARFITHDAVYEAEESLVRKLEHIIR